MVGPKKNAASMEATFLVLVRMVLPLIKLFPLTEEKMRRNVKVRK